MVSYISGKASDFFMDYIVKHENRWVMRTMYEALFDCSFPVNFKEELKAQLSKSARGKRNVRDFVREIEKLASRFPGVDEQTVIQTFWDGLNQNIRIRLIEWDMSPEHTPLEAIIRKAVSIENNEEALRRELKASGATRPSERKWGRFANRVDGPAQPL